MNVVYFLHEYFLLFWESFTSITSQCLDLLSFMLEVCLDLELKVFDYFLELEDVFIAISNVWFKTFLGVLNIIFLGLKCQSSLFELFLLAFVLSYLFSQAIYLLLGVIASVLWVWAKDDIDILLFY